MKRSRRKLGCPEYGKRETHKVPSLSYGETEPSEFLKAFLKKEACSPLLEPFSWTKSVPYNDSFLHYTPSEFIGSNYTPSARNLKIRHLPSFKRSHCRKSRPMVEKSKRPSNRFIKFDDIIIGHYNCPNSSGVSLDATMETPLRCKTKSKIYKNLQHLRSLKYSHLQAREPVSPDAQLVEMKKIIDIEQGELIRPEDVNKIEHYVLHEIEDRMIQKYPKECLDKAKIKLHPKFFQNKRLKPVFEAMEKEIVEDYSMSIRVAIVEYILLDKNERKRLSIHTAPKKYPTMSIRLPVPWHQQVIISRQFISYNLHICDKSMLAIQDLWNQNFSGLLVIPTNRLNETCPFPLNMDVMEMQINILCEEARGILLNDWLPKCAAVFTDMMACWAHLVPTKAGESLKQVERYFDSAASLMSIQLRSLIFKSLYHFLNMLLKFQVIILYCTI